MKTKTTLFFIFFILVFADQTSKYFSSNSICNQNIAWSIPIAPAIFYLAWFTIVAALIYLFLKTKSSNQQIFLVLILSGAISNMIDRIRLGCVIDHIDLKFWPVFNLADVYIYVGVIFLLASILKSQSQNPNDK